MLRGERRGREFDLAGPLLCLTYGAHLRNGSGCCKQASMRCTRCLHVFEFLHGDSQLRPQFLHASYAQSAQMVLGYSMMRTWLPRVEGGRLLRNLARTTPEVPCVRVMRPQMTRRLVCSPVRGLRLEFLAWTGGQRELPGAGTADWRTAQALQ